MRNLINNMDLKLGLHKKKMAENLLEIARKKLARIEDSIVLDLFERLLFKANLSIYFIGGIQVPKQIFLPDGSKVDNFRGSFLDYLLLGTEAVHASAGRYEDPEEFPFSKHLPKPLVPRKKKESPIKVVEINKNSEIMRMYISTLPRICALGEDKEYGSTAVCDIRCLQDISRRVHLGMHVAEAKFREDPEGYGALILAEDREGLSEKLRNWQVEQEVLKRAKQKGERYGIKPEFVAEFFEKHLIPLTINVEVEYFMRRDVGK